MAIQRTRHILPKLPKMQNKHKSKKHTKGERMNLIVKEIEFDLEGKVVGLKGTYKKRKCFSIITDKTLFWEEQGINYMGG